jgi:formiminotetrahydrofolate cyclodeaminase
MAETARKAPMDEYQVTMRKLLDPADNTTGGGSAAALAGAMAAALVAMVCRLSADRASAEDMPDHAALAKTAESLSRDLLLGATQDGQAFESVRQALRLSRATEREQEARRAAIGQAWQHATEVPLANAERCRQVLAGGTRLRGRSNPQTASDLSCALLLARAGLLGCLANVAINLPHVKDAACAADLSARARMLQAWTQALPQDDSETCPLSPADARGGRQ